MSRIPPGSSSEAFLPDPPILTPHDIAETYICWESGLSIPTGVVAVGQIALSELEQQAMGTNPMFADHYRRLPEQHPLGRVFQRSRGIFAAIVTADMNRGKMGSSPVELRTYAGFYRGSSPSSDVPVHRAYPHINVDGQEPKWQVNYDVVFGTPKILPISFAGDLCKGDVIPDGPRHGELIEYGSGLRKEVLPAGLVFRYMVSAHTSGDGTGTRLAHSATVTLPHPTE